MSTAKVIGLFIILVFSGMFIISLSNVDPEDTYEIEDQAPTEVSENNTEDFQTIVTTKHEFYPDEFLFEYSDGNTTHYKGDLGLKYAHCRNVIDNVSYLVPTENVRGIAFATNGTFKFNESILITHSIKREDDTLDPYIMLNMYYKNGTEIKSLDIEDDDLTADQRTYFDNYEQQRQEYLQKHLAEEIDTETTYNMMHDKYQKDHYSGYYVGSGGSGYFRTTNNY